MSVETTEYLAMAGRIVRAAGKRVADADEVELRMLFDLQKILDDAIVEAVRGQRRMGRSWAWLAGATSTSRQAMFKRFAAKVEDAA